MTKYKVTLNEKWCKSCGICAGFCPKNVFAMTIKKQLYVKDEAACIGCKMCEYRCPDFAVTVAEKGE